MELESLSKDQLLALRQQIAEELASRATSISTPMRSAEEYFEATSRARQTDQEQMFLKEQYLANGRMFTLTQAQAKVLEAKFDQLASREVTIYEVLWDGLEQKVLSFCFQCNVPKQTRLRGSKTTAGYIRDAQEFFKEVKQLEETPAAEPKQSKSKKAAAKRQQIVDDALKLLTQ